MLIWLSLPLPQTCRKWHHIRHPGVPFFARAVVFLSLALSSVEYSLFFSFYPDGSAIILLLSFCAQFLFFICRFFPPFNPLLVDQEKKTCADACIYPISPYCIDTWWYASARSQ